MYKILIEGYARPGSNDSYEATPTTTLIYSNNKKILVDPGTNKNLLLKALEKEGLTTKDIDVIYLSHYHPDHFLNIRLFPDTPVVDGDLTWIEDREYEHSDKMIPDTDITILPTPGHSPEHTSLLLTTDDGVVCIAQDVFWWENGEQETDSKEDMINYVDPYASDFETLKESRRKVLDVADWIIPGHGKMFKNTHRSE